MFTVKKIFHQYNSNEFYKHTFRTLKINAIDYQLPNKFDYRDKRIQGSKLFKISLKLYFILLKLIKYPLIVPKLFWADYFMHEYSNQTDSTRPIYIFQNIFPKKIFVYIHGQSLNQVGKNPKIIPTANKSILLLWHKNNIDLVKSIGYENLYMIGMTKFYSEWINYINQYNKSEKYSDKFVLIFTREPDHKYFMNFNIYKYLLLTSYNTVRKLLGDIKIVVKCHPRENTNYLNELISKNNLNNISVSIEHPAILSQKAYLAISFWTSAILDALSIGTPSVEYFKEPKDFRIVEPNGSMYKKYKIDSVDNENDLSGFITSVMEKRYNIPKIIDEFHSFKDIDFIEHNESS